MNIAIIGGGIAGIAAAISLKKQGFSSVVYEKFPSYLNKGKGFILLPNGCSALERIGLKDKISKRGLELKQVVIQNTEGTILKTDELTDTYSVVRQDFLMMLLEELGESQIEFDCAFDRFETDESGKITKAVFQNGKTVEADIFIGADGSNSRSRKYITNALTVPSRVKELVGLLHAPDIAENLGNTFVKVQSEKESLSFGIVPTAGGRIIWFMQYDSAELDFDDCSPEDTAAAALEVVKDWKGYPKEILKRSIGMDVYRWNTRDMDIPKQFHKNNFVMIGDALHPFLTFTSQGTGTALCDAIAIGCSLSRNKEDYQAGFADYQNMRMPALEGITEWGRQLSWEFLRVDIAKGKISIPLAFKS